MIRLGKVLFDILLVLGKSFNGENRKTALTSFVSPLLKGVILKFFFCSQMEINCPITATIVCNSPAMNHSYLTTLAEHFPGFI